MTGIESHPRLDDESARVANLLNFGDHPRAVGIPTEIPEGVGVGAGVYLTDLEAAAFANQPLFIAKRRGFPHQCLHIGYRRLHTDKYGSADDRMADVQLPDIG